MILTRRARAVLIAVPVLAAVLAGVSVMTTAPGDRAALVAAGLVAVASTIVALLIGSPVLVWLGVALLGVCFAVPIAAHGVVSWASVAYGLGLFLLAEFGSSSASSSARAANAARLDRPRVTYLVTVVVGSVVVGSVALAVAGLLTLGPAAELTGLVASVMVISVVLGLVNRLGAGRVQ
ncbi:MAG: hypothetical protein ACLQRM_04990 [Acidimicrobiales bacterium]